ncbi:MAG: hypothetical protein AN485_13480 [Anabaena sp. MDT14b]|jgi:hypothetical protein|nr:hypothetical protein [Dolichospermum sp. DET73]OBQ35497.1 MAG: hypothetical protein AN485_13480 [Anabaena sp. MDT14b]
MPTDTTWIGDDLNLPKDYYQKDKLDLDLWFQITQIDYEKLLSIHLTIYLNHLLKQNSNFWI